MAEIVDATKTFVITLTPPSAIISCTSATPHYSSGCALLLAYDRDNDGVISFRERSAAINDANAETITASEVKFVSDAYTAGSINALCTGCYTPPYVPPTPPPPSPPTIGGDPSSTATRKSLAAGDHNITITKSNYETVVAKINVSSKGEVTCESVTGGSCGGTGYPRVEATGTSVKVYMATGISVVTSYAEWVTSKGGAAGIRGKLAPVGNIIDGYLSSVGDIGYLGFTVTLGNVGSTIDYYLG